MSFPLSPGLYETLLDKNLRQILADHPELRAVCEKIDSEEQPERYAAFVAGIVAKVLRWEPDPGKRLALCNRIIETLAGDTGMEDLQNHKLIPAQKPLLLEITPPHYAHSGLPRPQTSMAVSSLFTGSPQEPQLVHELLEEMRSADEVDILVSFIKWSGLRLLMPGFADLQDRDIPVRVITTSYMGASDAPAVEWLARIPNVRVRISYDTERTRLHAKAYHFRRCTGFSTAYIGSANMSRAAMTSGLEWNLKVTEQDLQHILEKFGAEFETYWNSREFLPFDPASPEPLRRAIRAARTDGTPGPDVFFDLKPHPFQERILEALSIERLVRGHFRNLVIAATGTGKTVIAAFDYQRFRQERKNQARLLFVAHRQEILQQALWTFRNVLRDHSFGELLVGPYQAERLEHLFCSVGMLSRRRLWEQLGRDFYDYIIVDEAHHGPASSYRPLFDHFSPKILLGLTATPERMDGNSVAADFDNRLAAEIRLPEALEEKLLCPFHYFGVADPVDISADRFWRNGRYNDKELEKIYTGDHELARQRLAIVLATLHRYEPDLSRIKGIGFCVTIKHARFMADMFTRHDIPSAAFVSGLDSENCRDRLRELRAGRLTFLFTVDKLSEGVDVPEINTVLFLRPTQSLTVFLQQLGRGLRHAPEKECLTVLDFVGQVHRRYRIDRKLKALLPQSRYAIDREVENDFPHLPAGCCIQFDRISKQYVLENIKTNLQNLAAQIPERLKTFSNETGNKPTFANFIRYHDYEPEILLVRESWTGWKARARLAPTPPDPDFATLKKSLLRMASVSGPQEIAGLRKIIGRLLEKDVSGALAQAVGKINRVYYRFWPEPLTKLGFADFPTALERLAENRTILADMDEVLAWAQEDSQIRGIRPQLPFACDLELHARYGLKDIQAAFGRANLETTGQRGIGVLHFSAVKAYALLITWQKTDREFSPTTMYADYPISRTLLHWESQSNTTRQSNSGRNLINHRERGYTILIFARDQKTRNNCTLPFVYLGPAARVSYEKEKPIRMVWELKYPMPVTMFENNRRGG